MTTVVRPSTPFPHTHVLTHSRHESTYHPVAPTSYFSSRPLHFTLRPLPTPTPPSLLNRSTSTGSNHASSSSSSSSSRPQLPSSPRTPGLVSARRESSASVSSCETPLPTTPVLDESPLAPHPTPLELPSPMYANQGKALDLPPPEYNWVDKEFTSRTYFDVSHLPLDLCPLDPPSTTSTAIPVRPKIKRRDTPRPQTTTLTSLGMTDGIQRDEDGHRGKRRLTSLIDGGAWIVLEEGQ